MGAYRTPVNYWAGQVKFWVVQKPPRKFRRRGPIPIGRGSASQLAAAVQMHLRDSYSSATTRFIQVVRVLAQIVGRECGGMVLWLCYASLDRTSFLRVHKNGMHMLAHSQLSLATMPLPVNVNVNVNNLLAISM